MKKLFILLFVLFCHLSLSASMRPITSINIIDRNGMSETISSKERLAQFNRIDFTTPQPYQKVLRIYAKDKAGNQRSSITSYHPNGQLKQSLEAMNHRAYGPYLEFHANGKKKIESFVIGGLADINSQSEQSWLFDGISKAWDEEGHLLAEIHYQKGVLDGKSFHFHPNGVLWKEFFYKNNLLEGNLVTYLNTGELLQTAQYQRGVLHGESIRYWNPSLIAHHEIYQEGKIVDAAYYSKEGQLISQIVQGNGERAIFGKFQMEELQEYSNGIQQGLIKIFDDRGVLSRQYSIKEGEKEGEEIDYYSSLDSTLRPKIMLTWKEGVLQGVTQTWYRNGQMESRKEMCQNRKNGLATSWFSNGSLMYVEEYDNDTLVKGEYYRINEKEPCSIIRKGQGIATLFDAEGTLVQKVTYQDGKPTL